MEIMRSAVGASEGPIYPRPSLRAVLIVALLLFGGFALLGWFVGVALLWSNPCWTPRDKLLATFVWPGGLITVVPIGGMLGMALGITGNHDPLPLVWLALALFFLALIAPIAVAVHLLRLSARYRAHTGPGALAQPSS
jgi:hypothetical protein